MGEDGIRDYPGKSQKILFRVRLRGLVLGSFFGQVMPEMHANRVRAQTPSSEIGFSQTVLGVHCSVLRELRPTVLAAGNEVLESTVVCVEAR